MVVLRSAAAEVWPRPRGRGGAGPADARPLLLASQGGEDSVKPGEKFVLMKERSVMVVGFSHAEWRLLLDGVRSSGLQMR